MFGQMAGQEAILSGTTSSSVCVFPGLVHEDLKTFLLNNVPQGKKKAAKYVLGVADTKLGAAIQETLEIPCSFGE